MLRQNSLSPAEPCVRPLQEEGGYADPYNIHATGKALRQSCLDARYPNGVAMGHYNRSRDKSSRVNP
jgi:hypothetical protein